MVIAKSDDPTHAVYLVEARLADIAPVGDDELIRLIGVTPSAGRLIKGERNAIHFFSAGTLDPRVREAVAAAVDRRLIARMLFSGRGTAIEPTMTETEARRITLPERLTLIVDSEITRLHRRAVARIAYDLSLRGVAATISSSPPDSGAWIRYSSRFEGEVPDGASSLFTITPYWLVRSGIIGEKIPVAIENRRDR